MYNLENIIIDLILILFPFLIYFFHILYINSFNIEKNNLFLDISILSSFYLTMNYGINTYLVTIILILSFLKKRTISSIFLIILLLVLKFDIASILICLLLLLIYFLYIKKILNEIIMVVSCYIILFLSNLYITMNFIMLNFVYLVMLMIILYSYLLIESLIKVHYSVTDIVKENRYHNTLFKISHEIKNPIAVCKSYLDMFDFNDEDHERYIPIIKNEMDKILILLKDFSSLNNIKINKEIMDITILIDDVVKQFSPFLSNITSDFICDIVDDEIYIEGDYNRLNQVLVNIIKNAFESKESGLVIQIYTKINKDEFDIIIKDNGEGFDMKNIEKIKEPFFTTKRGGNGLGVALSFDIIEAHNGKIIYKSKKGKGTTVIIKLPMIPFE